MDERKSRLKQLKRDCKKEKRRHTALPGFFGVFFFVLAAIGTAAVLTVTMPELAAVVRLWEYVGEDPVKPLLEANLLPLMIGAGVLWGAYLIFCIWKASRRKKWKRTPEYLDYRTMKNTVRQEKKAK